MWALAGCNASEFHRLQRKNSGVEFHKASAGHCTSTPSGSDVMTRKSCHHPQHIRHTNLPIPSIMKYATSAIGYRCPGNGLEGYPKASEMEELKPES